MKKRALTIGFLVCMILITCAFTACPTGPPELLARDGIAAAKGFIETQQQLHLAECQAAPTESICVGINKAVAAQNLAIDALAIYCASPDFSQNKGPCVPNKSAEPKLREATDQLNDVLKQLEAMTGAKVMRAGIGDVSGLSFLGLLQFVLGLLGSLLAGLRVNPKYGGIVLSVENAIGELKKARDEVLTKEELESLRTEPKW